MKVIQGAEREGSSVLVEEYRNALYFLSLVTGIATDADYSSTFGYGNKEDYQRNMRDWKDWYKRNKYRITDKYVDSVYKRVGLKYKL